MAPRVETVGFPWERVRHSVVVYISLGTLFNTDATFYRRCFDAFRDEDFQVIMSVGANAPPRSLGSPPANFIVQAYVPQLDVLQRASAFVTHGGMNSVSESLYYGVPVVVVPQMGEQAIVGRRVEELGAGLYLAKEEVTVETLRASVRRLLAEDRFARQAGEIRESFQNAGGVTRAADAIFTFTTQQRLRVVES
jgi:MGT family glycosyltransferase